MVKEQQQGKFERLKAVRRGHCGVITKFSRETEEIVNNVEGVFVLIQQKYHI